MSPGGLRPRAAQDFPLRGTQSRTTRRHHPAAEALVRQRYFPLEESPSSLYSLKYWIQGRIVNLKATETRNCQVQIADRELNVT